MGVRTGLEEDDRSAMQVFSRKHRDEILRKFAQLLGLREPLEKVRRRCPNDTVCLGEVQRSGHVVLATPQKPKQIGVVIQVFTPRFTYKNTSALTLASNVSVIALFKVMRKLSVRDRKARNDSLSCEAVKQP